MPSHIFGIGAGHRNTDGGGAIDERGWTDDAAFAMKAEIEKRGGKGILLFQRDGDSDQDESLYKGLQGVARLAIDVDAKEGPLDAVLFNHYNGTGSLGSSGFHAIYADKNETNPLDAALCWKMAQKVRATNTVGLLNWTIDAKAGRQGVMKESETRVGAVAGQRLGEFVGSMGIRDHAARIILEAANISNPREAAYIRDPRWVQNVYVVAIVDALEEQFGKFEAQAPVLVPNNPVAPVYAKAYVAPEVLALKDTPTEYVPIVIRLDVPAYGGQPARVEKMVRVMDTVTAKVAIGRLQTLDPEGARVWKDIAIGEKFFVPFVGFHNGRPYTRTWFGTVIYLDGTDFGLSGV